MPIIFSDLLYSSVNLVDNIMIGSLGINEITAVGLANQIFFVFFVTLFGICSGASIFMGQFWGKKDTLGIQKTMGICLLGCLFVALCFSLFTFLKPELLMRIYSSDEQVLKLSTKYLRTISAAYFLLAFTLTINFSLRCIGKTAFPLIATIAALCCNIVLNYIFIYILKLGVYGAALATLISRSLELIVQLWLINYYKMPIVGKLKNYFSADLAFIKEYFKITSSVIANEVLWALGTTLYIAFYKYTGTEGQGAFQIASTAQGMFFTVGMGIGSASGIMIANTLGAGEREKAIEYSRKCMFFSVATGVIMGILFTIASPLILSFFEITEVVRFNTQMIVFVLSIGMCVKMLNYAAIVGVLRNGGDTFVCFLYDLLSVWLVGVPLTYFGAKYFGLPIYFVVALTYSEEIAKVVFSVKRVLSNVWANSLVEKM